MKKLFLACAMILGITAAASAENYMAAYAGYAGTSISKLEIYNGYDETKKINGSNGFELGYIYGLGLGEESPMAVEFGLSLGYGVSTTKLTGIEYTAKQFNLKVPVNFTYKFNIGETVAIAPYAGINFRFNPLFEGELKYEDGDKYTDKEGFKKFQMGWQAGAKVYFKSFFVYGQYGTDFMPAVKVDDVKCNSRNFAVGVGYKF